MTASRRPGLISLEFFDIIIVQKIRKETSQMSTELAKALLLIAKFCIIQDDCSSCPLKDFCMKQPSSW